MRRVVRSGAAAVAAAGIIAARRSMPRRRDATVLPALTDEDRREVEAWVAEEIRRLRELPYDRLVLHEGQELHSERLTPSGAHVVRETRVHWDDPVARTLRVWVDARQPVSGWVPPSVAKDDFIRAPDGSFVGE